jgi:adenylate kinase family enzyme
MILLLSGWSGSGKDATASILIQKYDFQRLAFADILKEIVAKEFHFPVEWTRTEQGKQNILSNGKTVRENLIQRGQEIRQEKGDPGFFARKIAQKIHEAPSNQKYAISDWRFPVELKTLRQELPDRQILPIRIQRQNQEVSGVQDDFTEHQLDSWPFDFLLNNPGTNLQGLEKYVDKFMNNFSKETE